MKAIYDYSVDLIGYVLTGKKPHIPSDIDYKALLEFSEDHGISNMIYAALSELNVDVPPEIMSLFEEDYEMQVVLEANQAYELDSLGEELEKAGIDYMPLKGSVVKDIYPMPDYRHSGDIDILVHEKDIDRLRPIMDSLGYVPEDEYEGHDIHIVYNKPPMIKVEVHRQLVKNSNRAYDFCQRVWERSKVKEGTAHCYCMNNECLYTYMMAHLAKHLYSGGAGIRLVTDIWVMRRKLTFDSELLHQYLEEAKLADIDEMMVGLVSHMYDGKDITDSRTQILENIVFTGGSFGSAETKQLISGNDSYLNKVTEFFKMVFPSVRALSGKYSVLRKRPYLYPIVWFSRLFSLATEKRQGTIDKMKSNFYTNRTGEEIADILAAVK